MARPARSRWQRVKTLRGLVFATVAVAAAFAALAMLAISATALLRVANTDGGASGDFISFYGAGHLVRTGNGANLYDPAAQSWVQHALYPGDLKQYVGYPLPVFAAWGFAPLSKLGYVPAFFAWFGVNLALLAALVCALGRHLSPLPALPRRVFLAAFALSVPVLADLVFGQVDLFVFAGLLSGYLLMRTGRGTLAGIALSLVVVKPHFLIGVVLLLIVSRRWRTLATLVACGAPLLVVPALLTSTDALVANLSIVGRYPGADTDMSVNAALMSNWRGFVVSVTGRNDVWLWLPGLIVIAAGAFAVAISRWWRAPASETIQHQSYALAVMLPLLISPHLHTQSLMFLFIAEAIMLRCSFDAPSLPGIPASRDTMHAVKPTLALNAALFALWIAGVQGLTLMVFLIILLFLRYAYLWPAASRVRAGDVNLRSLTPYYRRRYDPTGPRRRIA